MLCQKCYNKRVVRAFGTLITCPACGGMEPSCCDAAGSGSGAAPTEPFVLKPLPHAAQFPAGYRIGFTRTDSNPFTPPDC